MEGFVAVHVGAGHHSSKLHSKYKQLCRHASRLGCELLKQGNTAIYVVEQVTAFLEDSPLTNAGLGSSLTWDGSVECDASIMNGRLLTWGAVGAVPGVKNPIKLAKHLCDKQTSVLALGRVPPCLLVGPSAREWAMKANLTVVTPSDLITPKSLKLYQHYRRKVAKYEAVTGFTLTALDTIGVVAADMTGDIASSCSSGGLALKHSGRVGQAAMYGCGVWAECTPELSIAACTSGCGEHLTRTMLAKQVADELKNAECPTSALYDVMKHKFLESPFLHGVEEKLAGVAVLKLTIDGYGEFLWAHTTDTMGLGYMSTTDTTPRSRISCMPVGISSDSRIVVEGTTFKLNRIAINKMP